MAQLNPALFDALARRRIAQEQLSSQEAGRDLSMAHSINMQAPGIMADTDAGFRQQAQAQAAAQQFAQQLAAQRQGKAEDRTADFAKARFEAEQALQRVLAQERGEESRWGRGQANEDRRQAAKAGESEKDRKARQDEARINAGPRYAEIKRRNENPPQPKGDTSLSVLQREMQDAHGILKGMQGDPLLAQNTAAVAEAQRRYDAAVSKWTAAGMAPAAPSAPPGDSVPEYLQRPQDDIVDDEAKIPDGVPYEDDQGRRWKKINGQKMPLG